MSDWNNRPQGPEILAEQDREASITSDRGLLILPEGREVDSMTISNPFCSTDPMEKQILILQIPWELSSPLSVPTGQGWQVCKGWGTEEAYKKQASQNQTIKKWKKKKTKNQRNKTLQSHLPQPNHFSINLKNLFKRTTMKSYQIH